MISDDIQKGLEREARLVTERISMDTTELNARQKGKSLREFMKARNLSQADIAKNIGMSPGVISQFLKGTYKGDVDALIGKIVDLINSVTSRERRIRNKPYIETTVAKSIGDLIAHTIAFSEEEGKIGLVIGDSGHGKSTCLRQYAEVHQNAIYIEMHTAMTSRSLFARLAEHEKIKVDSSGNLDSLAERLISNLRNREVIIIIDEASGLTVKQLNQLRTVIMVSAHCPLILAGNQHLLVTVNQKSTRRGFESLDQLRSRLMAVLHLDMMAGEKGGGLYSVEDIRKLYEFGGIRLLPDAITSLQKISRWPGSGRLFTCSNIISALLTSGAITKEGRIDSKHIVAVIKELRLPAKDWLATLGMKEPAEQPEEQAGMKAG